MNLGSIDADYLLRSHGSIRPKPDDIEALCGWAVQALKLGPTGNDPNRANVTRAAVSSMMVLLRNERARVIFVKAGGVGP